MKGAWATIGTIATLAQQCVANLDVITLPTRGSTYIQEAEATLVLGDVPNPITGDVALWSAIMMDQQDFLQGVTQNSPGSTWCRNLGNNWCNFAYTLKDSFVTSGTPVSAVPGSKVRTHYKLNASTNLWDQNMYINDELVSTVSTSKGQHGNIFYVSIECAAAPCTTAPAHSWQNISITLNEADQSFKHSGSWEYKATGGEMSTADNGKTWKFTTLFIPAILPQ